ncbi:hypothetical protein [Paracoccus sp. SM22M-07]|uniref:hypothetical protein n=1 Tax=Paracoccus sp. SM22M-07 TaxID=1520813 RepID=UPI0009302BC8|nr:hypothetical protein [Paracoccus sp. SM22M-07]
MSVNIHTDDPDLLTISKVDAHLQAALISMVEEGVTVRFALSRLLAFAALQYVVNEGEDRTVEVLREAAQNVEDGRLSHRVGEKYQPN